MVLAVLAAEFAAAEVPFPAAPTVDARFSADGAVESESTFRLLLPLAEATTPPPPPAAARSTSKRLCSATVKFLPSTGSPSYFTLKTPAEVSSTTTPGYRTPAYTTLIRSPTRLRSRVESLLQLRPTVVTDAARIRLPACRYYASSEWSARQHK